MLGVEDQVSQSVTGRYSSPTPFFQAFALLFALVIFTMRPNPIPGDIVSVANAERTKVPGDTSRANALSGVYFLEVEARREWVIAELLIGLSRLRTSGESRLRASRNDFVVCEFIPPQNPLI